MDVDMQSDDSVDEDKTEELPQVRAPPFSPRANARAASNSKYCQYYTDSNKRVAARLRAVAMKNHVDIMENFDKSKKYLFRLQRSMGRCDGAVTRKSRLTEPKSLLPGFEHIIPKPPTNLMKPFGSDSEERCSSDTESASKRRN